MARRMWDENEIIKIAEEHGGEGGGAVKSVNGKTGTVVLKAEDINATNSQSVQANLERIDLEVEGLTDDVADLNSGKLDANKAAVSSVGGLVIPTVAPTSEEIVGINTDGSQMRITVGSGLNLTNGELTATGGSGPAPENMMTTDTDQQITGYKTFMNGAQFGGTLAVQNFAPTKLTVGTSSANVKIYHDRFLHEGHEVNWNDVASITNVNQYVSSDAETLEYITINHTNYKITGGGSGSVEIDEKTIVRDDDGKLKTSIGGYIEGKPAEKLINAAGDVNLVWTPNKSRYQWPQALGYTRQALVSNRINQGLEPLAATNSAAYDDLELNHAYPITLNGEAATITFLSRSTGGAYNSLTGVIGYRSGGYNVVLDYGTDSVWANIKISTLIEDVEIVALDFTVGTSTEVVHPIDPRVIPVDNDTIKVEDGVLKAQGGGSVDTSKFLRILTPGPDGLLSEEDRQYVGPGSVIYYNGKISFFGFWGSDYDWDQDEAEYFAYDYLTSWGTNTVGYFDPQRIAVNRRDGTIGGPWGWGERLGTGNKLLVGDTEITEAQFQALLALIS